ncbi:hypothetical protein M3P19_09435 [Muricauda sp. 2012CJ35-5]|uniref:Uncharacterized protein n=1 Tax=Flagellimonas spongiicola TaxID=2942208 RepID=A0ABT0PS72_9FLAO|nr:hypothetical protein [Allomuricauda spongiicola]MCL6274232.1 hypothetical protein [Allomuricauda spongiicola]
MHNFEVEYRILGESEGGRRNLPSPGIKWDFSYEHPSHTADDLFMIWPQFLDKNGKVISKSIAQVPQSGSARMWVVSDDMKKYHKDKIYVGMKAYGMEGPRIVAHYLVTKIVDFAQNTSE